MTLRATASHGLDHPGGEESVVYLGDREVWSFDCLQRRYEEQANELAALLNEAMDAARAEFLAVVEAARAYREARKSGGNPPTVLDARDALYAALAKVTT